VESQVKVKIVLLHTVANLKTTEFKPQCTA